MGARFKPATAPVGVKPSQFLPYLLILGSAQHAWGVDQTGPFGMGLSVRLPDVSDDARHAGDVKFRGWNRIEEQLQDMKGKRSELNGK